LWPRYILPSVALLALLTILTVPSAYADPFQTIEQGKNFDNQYIGTTDDGSRIYQWSTKPDRILDGNQYKDYILFQDSSIVRLETANAGSITFNKNTCAYDLHNI
jgi:hypothetical protein